MIHLSPSADWHLIASDAGADIWLTRASMVDLLRYEPAVTFPSSDSSRPTLQKLRKTDYAAFALFDKLGNRLTVECRPRSGDRIYVGSRPDGFDVAAGIKHAPVSSAVHSSGFLAVWLANAVSFPGFNYFLGRSPFENVHLVMHGHRGEWIGSTGAVSCLSDEPGESACSTSNVAEAVGLCRATLEDAVEQATRGAHAAAECSGGIDSSLVAVIAKRVCGSRFHGGVFADYPYHEFRQERPFAQAVAEREGFELHVSDHNLCVCWGAQNQGRTENPGYEPSLSVPFWGQTLSSYDIVRDHQAITILNGHGGDLLFEDREPPHVLDPRPKWLPKDLWGSVLQAVQAGLEWIKQPARFASGYRFVNPWLSRSLSTARPGAIYASPLTTRAVISSFINLRRYLKENHPGSVSAVQKPIAHLVFGDYLPAQVWLRRSKINFAGNFYRSWLKHGADRVSLIRRMGPTLNTLGLDSTLVLKEVIGMADGRKSSDGLLNALVTYAFWRERLSGLTR